MDLHSKSHCLSQQRTLGRLATTPTKANLTTSCNRNPLLHHPDSLRDPRISTQVASTVSAPSTQCVQMEASRAVARTAVAPKYKQRDAVEDFRLDISLVDPNETASHSEFFSSDGWELHTILEEAVEQSSQRAILAGIKTQQNSLVDEIDVQSAVSASTNQAQAPVPCNA